MYSPCRDPYNATYEFSTVQSSAESPLLSSCRQPPRCFRFRRFHAIKSRPLKESDSTLGNEKVTCAPGRTSTAGGPTRRCRTSQTRRNGPERCLGEASGGLGLPQIGSSSRRSFTTGRQYRDALMSIDCLSFGDRFSGRCRPFVMPRVVRGRGSSSTSLL